MMVRHAAAARPESRRRTASVLVATASLLLSVLALPARAAITPSPTAANLADAISAEPSTVAGASFLTSPPSGTPTAVADAASALASFPTDGSTYGILSSGDATIAANPNDSGSSGADDGGTPGTITPSRGDTAYDVSSLQVDLNVPADRNCLQIDFRFLSEEFPEYVGSSYNDGFIAELDTSDWTTSGSTISAPGNFAFDPDHQVISINGTGATHMTAEDATGTTYDGATPLLIAQTPITGGAHSVYLSIFDQGDSAYDSAVFLDNLALGTTSGSGQCEPGARPALSNLSLSVSPTSTQGGFSDTPTDQIDPTALGPQAQGPQAAPATAPIGHSPIGHSPIGHSPIGHSPIGHSPLGPDSPLRGAPLTALPLSSVPPVPLPSVFTPDGWEVALQGTDLANQPVQLLTLQQVAALSPSPVGLGDVDLSGTVFAQLSPASLLFGNTTLGQLGITPPSGFGSGDTLAKVELGGVNLASLGAGDVVLKGHLAASSPLALFSVDGIDLSLTPLGGLPASTSPSLVDCSTYDCTGKSLADAETDGAIVGSSTVATVLALNVAEVNALTLAQLLPGILDSAYVDYGAIPLSRLTAAAPLAGPFVQYTATATVSCSVAEAAHYTVQLPTDRFRYQPGSASFSVDGGGTTAGPVPAPQATGDPNPPEPTVDGASLDWALPPGLCADGQQSADIVLTFSAQPGPDTGTFTSTFTATAGAFSVSLADAAPLDVTEVFEPNDGVGGGASPTPIQLNHLYTSQIGSSSDLDYYSLDTSGITPGSVLRVDLSHVPADFDVVLYGPAAAANLRGAPIGHSPIGHSPIGHSPLSDDQNCLPPGGVVQPQSLQDVPILPEDSGLAVRGYSTNRSTTSELVCTVVQPGDASLVVQVSGFNLATSGMAYLLDAQVSGPPDPLECPPASFSGTGTPGAAPGPIPSTTQTLILVNAERIGRVYGADAETAVMSKLGEPAFLNAPNVQGVVVPVESNPAVAQAYGNWDASPCSPDLANGVVSAINQYVDQLRTQYGLTELKNIVIGGGDVITPFARVPEIVPLGSESTEAGNLVFDGQDNPTARALALGNILTDDWYASFAPQPFLSTQLPVPSVAVGRLVETPEDIIGAVEQYEDFNGALDPTTESTFGYDFMTDGAQATEAALNANGFPQTNPNTSHIDETWSRSDVVGAVDQVAAHAGLIALDAHFDQYRALPAGPFHSGTPAESDLYTTADLGAASANEGTILFTMGCHAGLNVPDVYASGADPRTADWAQTSAGKRWVFEGGTGYGYGDTTVIAYSEKLMQLFAQNVNDTMSVGQAMALAKQTYLASQASLSGVDAKVLQEATFYGLPMYVIGPNGQVAGPTPPPNPVPTQQDPATGLQSSSVTFSNLTDPSAPVTTPDGTYFTSSDGLAEAQPNRPLQPVSAPVDVTAGTASSRRAGSAAADPPAQLRLHGGLITGLTVVDLPGSDPVFAPPTFGTQENSTEPLITDGSFPSAWVNTSAQDTVFGRRDFLTVFGGRFESDPTTPGMGTQTLFTSMTVRTFYSTSDDFSVGTLSTLEAQDLGSSITFTATNAAADVAQMVVSYRLVGGDTYQNFELTKDESYQGPGSRWVGTLATPTNVKDYFAQWVMEGTGAVGVSTFKGLLYVTKPVITSSVPGTPKYTDEGTTFVTSATRLRVFVTSSSGLQSCAISVRDAGDNEVAAQTCGTGANDLFLTGLPDGAYTLTTTATDTQGNVTSPGDPGNTPLAVTLDDTAPVVGPCPEAGPFLLNSGSHVVGPIAADDQGGSGVDDATTASSVGTSSVGDRTATFDVADHLGNAAKSFDCVYAVRYAFDGFQAPVSNPPAVNAVSPGTTVPVRWHIEDANGAGVADPASFVKIRIRSAPTCSGDGPFKATTVSHPRLVYLGGGDWQFNWKTRRAFTGTCKTLYLFLNDGLVPTAGGPRTAYFSFPGT